MISLIFLQDKIIGGKLVTCRLMWYIILVSSVPGIRQGGKGSDIRTYNGVV